MSSETALSMILRSLSMGCAETCVTFEEGTWAAWLYDLLKPHVTKVVVCDPRRNALLQEGNQNDRVDARKPGRTVAEQPTALGLSRRPRATGLEGTSAQLSDHHRRSQPGYDSGEGHPNAVGPSLAPVSKSMPRAIVPQWLAKISEPGSRRRAEFYYQQLDALRCLRQEVRRDLLLAESKKHQAWKLLCGIPSIGPIRAAVLLGILQNPHRFRTNRQLWTYGGVGIETSSSADHHVVKGRLERKKKVEIRRPNRKYNHDLKKSFQGSGDRRRD